jgi:uncharacterized protein
MLGGLFLCFEGVEKLVHQFFTPHHVSTSESGGKSVAEAEKIKGAFVLSAEIIVITLGTVAATTLLNQVLVLVGVSAIMVIAMFSLVAGVVKLDDARLYLSVRKGETISVQLKRKLGFV